ncbi:MAG: hypothetical protein ABIP74_00815 [Candidatus Saccharimonas sp.]
MHFSLSVLRTGLLAALFLVIWIPLAAHAESTPAHEDNITMTPTTKQYDVKSGTSITDSFTIINNGTTTYDFKVYAKPYAVKDTSYEPIFSELNEFADGYKWVSLPSVSYHLAPTQKVSVPYDIIVSPGARSGGHYAAIFAEAQGTLSTGQTGVASNKSVGMLVYINVAGSSVTMGALKSIDMPWYQPAAPLTAIPRIENTGETDFSANVTFAVMDIAGDVKYQASSDYALLPKSERDIRYTWDKSPWFGLYKARVSTTLLGKTEVRESYIVIAPRWLIFVVFLGIILGAINVVRRKHTTTKPKSH